ncbi:MAG: hypothetical protein A2Z14_03200 [Chloroflexi bacterium RBG_16_48_8]|nr:MAG: hypothetical protein A2Z14_03200 [Chloroflexi bacterium RBG_16_48_8]
MIPDWQPVLPKVQPILGVPEGPYLERTSPEGQENFRQNVARLVERGFKIIRRKVMPDFEAIAERHQCIMAAEAAQVHARWFADYASLYHEKTADLIRQGQSISIETLQEALPGREKLREELMTAMEKAGIDLWIAPAARGTAPFGLQSTGDPVMNLPWTHSGLPTITLPSGFNEIGLPFGLQVVGRWYGDELLLAWASEMEGALGGQTHQPEDVIKPAAGF